MKTKENLLKTITGIFLVAVISISVSACNNKGPAEEAGEKLDQMATDAGNALEDACEDVKEGANAEDTDC